MMTGTWGQSPHRLLIDGGTTHTRIWAVVGNTVIAHARIMVGARDSARDGSSRRLAEAVGDLLARVTTAATQRVADWRPDCVVATGMITSPLGLANVPHVTAPAGLTELAARTRVVRLPDVSPLPLLCVPGVRCGPAAPDEESVSRVDVMRGEEAVCIGLLRTGVLAQPGLVLSLGSHWKLVHIDDAGRITGSTTTLSGEVLHVLRAETVLSASVVADMPNRLDLAAVRMGVREQHRSGLLRAAFCTRLLDAVPTSSPSSRLAYLVGTVVGETLDHWRTLLAKGRVALLGAPTLSNAWEDALTRAGLHSVIVDEAAAAAGIVAGLTGIAELVPNAFDSPPHAC